MSTDPEKKEEIRLLCKKITESNLREIKGKIENGEVDTDNIPDDTVEYLKNTDREDIDWNRIDVQSNEFIEKAEVKERPELYRSKTRKERLTNKLTSEEIKNFVYECFSLYEEAELVLKTSDEDEKIVVTSKGLGKVIDSELKGSDEPKYVDPIAKLWVDLSDKYKEDIESGKKGIAFEREGSTIQAAWLYEKDFESDYKDLPNLNKFPKSQG